MTSLTETAFSRATSYEYWAARNPGWDQATELVGLGLTVYSGFKAGGIKGAVGAYIGWVAGKVLMSGIGERRADTHAQMDMGYNDARTKMSDVMLQEVNKLPRDLKEGRWSMEIDMANGEVLWVPHEARTLGQTYSQFKETIPEWSERNRMLILPTQQDVLQHYIKHGNRYQKLFYTKWSQEIRERGYDKEEHKWAFVNEDGVASVHNFVGEFVATFDINSPITTRGQARPADPSVLAAIDLAITGSGGDGDGLGEENDDVMHEDEDEDDNDQRTWVSNQSERTS